jgi:cytochrome c oxidase subunit I
VSTVAALRRRREAAAGEHGLHSWLTTTDHKRIGLLYIGTALVYLLVALVFALTMRTQLAAPRAGIVAPGAYNQIFTMHGTTMIFLFGMPILSGLANYLVPLQIGARDVAFPRLNAFSYWVYLFGGLFLFSSFLFGGAIDTGWFSYAPLNQAAYSPHDGVTFWTLSLAVLGVSSLAGSVNLIVTMLRGRAPGMTLGMMPLFSIATFVNQFLILFAIPSLTAAVAMLYLDRLYDTVFFRAELGGDPVIWQHLFWFFGHPEVYILILPAFGIVSEIVPVFSRRPLFGRTTMIVMIAIIGGLGFSVWAHHMFAVGLPTYFNAIMAATSMIIAVPTGVKIFNWLATMWNGSLRFNTPLLFCCGLIAFFTIGGITGVTLAVVPFNWQVTDTYYVVAHLHNVLIPGTVFAVFGGFYYWFPKATGRLLDDGLGKVHFWGSLIGFGMTFLPMYALGILGMPRRVYTYAPDLGWDTLNLVSTAGAFVLVGSIVVFVINVVRSLRRGEPAGSNPFAAWTLEWATTSPPPPANFAALPVVTSDRPLWGLQGRGEDAAGGDAVAGGASAAADAAAVGGAPGGATEGAGLEHTGLPALAALGIVLVAAGLLGVPLLSVAGAAVLLAAMARWVWAGWPEAEEPAPPGERFTPLGLGMLAFLGSEVVLFGALIYAYVHLRLHALIWPPEGMPPLDVVFPAFNTALLLLSGVTAEWAMLSFRKGASRTVRVALVATIVLGAAFLAGQAYEYTHVGFGLSDGLLGSAFFTLTGFHGAHVTGGVMLLVFMLVRVVRDGRLGFAAPPAGTTGMMQAGTYYWHFVDVVWLVLFVVIYLL